MPLVSPDACTMMDLIAFTPLCKCIKTLPRERGHGGARAWGRGAITVGMVACALLEQVAEHMIDMYRGRQLAPAHVPFDGHADAKSPVCNIDGMHGQVLEAV